LVLTVAQKIEKLSSHQRKSRRGALARRFSKRLMHRTERRLAKILLDDAPKRRSYRGWDD
jgi:hypothetical protein